MKTAELTGAALDWAVAMTENWAGADFEIKPCSTDWAQGGPIIEREKLSFAVSIEAGIRAVKDNAPLHTGDYRLWVASRPLGKLFYGPTPLIAAMRCYVAGKLGDEVDVSGEMLR